MSALARRSDYVHFLRIQTRWKDNDVYGHINNVVYYSYFDTAVNRFLISDGKLDIHNGTRIGLCIESHCRYVAPAAYPEELDAGLRVEKLGKTSVRYGVGIFRHHGDEPCAFGHFVHVFVDRVTRRPSEIDGALRAALERLMVGGPPPARPAS